jgi:hypothetical protein
MKSLYIVKIDTFAQLQFHTLKRSITRSQTHHLTI